MKDKKGSVLILGLLMMAVLLLFGGVFLSLTTINYNTIFVSSDVLKAHWIAYAGIKKIAWELQDNYSNVEFQSKTENFGEGSYNTVTTSLKSGGVHDILVVSKGSYNNTKEVLIARFQLDTPTDYLYFFDGNGEIGNSESSVNIPLGGPIHSNSNLTFTTYHGYIYVVKPVSLSGSTVSSAGLVVRSAAADSSNDNFWDNGPVLIGEGTASFDKDFNYTGYIPANNLDYYKWGFRFFSAPSGPFPNDFTNSDWARSSTNPSPPETFPTSDTPLGLLNDGFHNGYYIKIPTIRKTEQNKKYTGSTYADLPFMNAPEWQKTIKELYEAYIDENYYIKGEEIQDNYANKYYRVSNAGIFKKKSFINDSYRTKWIVGTGNGINREFIFPNNYPSDKENIAKQDSGGSLTSFNFFPARRRIKNIYVNGANINTLPGYTFTAYYKSSTNLNVNLFGSRSKIAIDFIPSSAQKNVKIAFSDDSSPFRIAIADDSTTTFEYYPGTIDKVYIGNSTTWIWQWISNWTETTAYTLLNADHSVSATTLTSTNPPTNTIFQSSDPLKQNFAKLFKSDPLKIYRNGNPIPIYSAEGGGAPTINDGTISSIDYTNGKVTFSNSESGAITSEYIARAIKFNTAPAAEYFNTALGYGFYFPNIGIKYTGEITIAEGYPVSSARSFSIPHQDDINGKIQRVIVDGQDAYCIIANYYDMTYSYHRLNGKIIFSSAPPANADISTDYYRQIYLINSKTPKISNNYWAITRKDDEPPLIQNSTEGIYRWYDYQINGNRITFFNSGASSNGYGFPTPLSDPDPTPASGALVCVDPTIHSVVIDLDNISKEPKRGIIFSEVPVIVKGRAKFPVTIVCLADVYLQSINDGISEDSGNAYPVGIVSARGVWIDFSGTYESDVNHLTPVFFDTNMKLNKFYDVIINKVAIYTTRGLFNNGGKREVNRSKFIGSVCSLHNSFGRRETQEDFSADYIDFDHNFHQYNYGAQIWLYANSFRGDIENYSGIQGSPPHMPIYLQQLYFRSASIDNVDRFMNNVTEYISNKRKIPKEIYFQFLKELES